MVVNVATQTHSELSNLLRDVFLFIFSYLWFASQLTVKSSRVVAGLKVPRLGLWLMGSSRACQLRQRWMGSSFWCFQWPISVPVLVGLLLPPLLLRPRRGLMTLKHHRLRHKTCCSPAAFFSLEHLLLDSMTSK